MRPILGAVLTLCCGTVQADVLGLVDYDALFAANADAIEVLANGAEAIELPGGVFVSRQDGQIVTLDQSNGGAVGCFVNILAQIESYQMACDVSLDAGQAARLEIYRTQALTFYAANVSPTVTLDTARARFDTLRDRSQYASGAFCDPDGNIALFLNSFLDEATQEVLDRLTEVPRLPASNPCL